MSIVVFWIKPGSGEGLFPNMSEPQARTFTELQLTDALAFANRQRNEGFRHVCISMEHSDNVTKPGVDGIVDGKTPDGEEYTWRKRR
jgi:hypothetical protein